jgi:hypothetical protein
VFDVLPVRFLLPAASPDVLPPLDAFATAISVTSSCAIGPTMRIIAGFIALLGPPPSLAFAHKPVAPRLALRSIRRNLLRRSLIAGRIERCFRRSPSRSEAVRAIGFAIEET